MPHSLLIFSQSDYLIQIFAINLHSWWQTVQILISWLLQKPTDLDLHCLQNRIYPGSAGQGLRVASEHRVKLVDCWSALNSLVSYTTDHSKAVVPVLLILFVALDVIPGNSLRWFISILVLLNPDIPCLWKQCRSRSVGFWRLEVGVAS